MTKAFVLGNGTSRQGVNLNQLRQHGKIYGCNALYREFTPDVLVATDRPISAHIQEIGYPQQNKFYTRKPIEGLGALRVPQEYYGFSSGPIAAGIAAKDGNYVIYMLGFDMGPNEHNQINNLYAGTEFYRRLDAPPTFTGNWIKQIVRVVSDHPNVKFYRICGKNTARIPELETLKNLTHQDLTPFLDRINNQKDF